MEHKRLFGAISSVHRALIRQNDFNLAGHGISAVQLHTLVFIHIKSKEGKKVCQRDVEKQLNLRASSVSTLLANLTSCGYVTRTFAEGDARTKYIELTEKGEKLCLEQRELMDKCDAIIQDALTEEEQEQLKVLLIKIFNHINE